MARMSAAQSWATELTLPLEESREPPRATLVMQSLLDSNGRLRGIPADLRQLFATPYKDNSVRIHTNSWGSSPFPYFQIAYNNQTFSIDDFVHNNREMVILFASGNHGMDTQPRDGVVDIAQIGAEAAAKNCISIGASESYRPNLNLRYSRFGFSNLPLASDQVANDTRGMAAFSSRGPTREGRIKPDVVAPGTCILSTWSSFAPPFSDWGGNGGDSTYTYLGGTSMATPLAAGCCAVLRESLVKNGNPNPSAALIKALLINGAVELEGQYIPTEAGRSPNDASGWGRIDIANSIIIGGAPDDHGMVTAGNGSAGFRDEANTLDTSETFSFSVQIVKPGRTLKITLVWTEPPGAWLQNDLDLVVISPNKQTERHGNHTSNFNYNSQAHFDRKNNVEQIAWENIPQGAATVQVRAHDVTSWGGQTFALAWKVF